MMEEAHKKMIQGIEILVDYVKSETNKEIANLVKQKLGEFFK